MKTRRQFLQLGALAATAAVLPRRSRAQADGPASPVPTTPDTAPPAGLIDLHNHWISPGALEILSTKTAGVRYVTNEKGEHLLVRPGVPAPSPGQRPPGPRGTQMFDGPEVRLRHLDQHGVQRQLISWPTTSNVDPDLTAEEARLLWATYNDDLSALVRKHPDRFSGVAALPPLTSSGRSRNSPVRTKSWG
jgi:predicted TIM-barrel fold metal-dependent hydrolase